MFRYLWLLTLAVTLQAQSGVFPPAFSGGGGGGGGGGGVSSVALVMPASFCSVSGSPVTGSGTLTCTYATGQTPNLVFGTDGSGNVGLMALTTTQLPSAASIKTYLSLATVATSGSASDLSAGTLPAARLPNPSGSSLGGVQSLAVTTHLYMTGISTSGVPTTAHPACADLSDAGSGCSGSSSTPVHSFTAYFNSPGTALTSGQTVYVVASASCTVLNWSILVDTGTATVDVWKITSTTALPTITNTITASATPAIATGTKAASSTLTGWTTSVASGDVVGINLKTVASATLVSFAMACQ